MIRLLAALSALLSIVLGTGHAQVSRLSGDSSQNEGNWHSEAPAVSADGLYVAFRSYSSNLVNGDSKGLLDVFLRDRQLGVTTRVSVRANGVQGNAPSDQPAIAAGGGFVAFTRQASNLVGGDTNGTIDVFVRDLQAGATTRISVDSEGAPCTGDCLRPSTSVDGGFVAFESIAVHLVSGDARAAVHSLSIRHHRQISFDLARLW